MIMDKYKYSESRIINIELEVLDIIFQNLKVEEKSKILFWPNMIMNNLRFKDFYREKLPRKENKIVKAWTLLIIL